MENNEIIVRNEAGVELGGPNARLNVTVNGQNGDYPDALRYDMTDGDVKQVATEAVRTGYIPGVTAAEVNFQDFVVDRFPATNELPPRLMLRPKTPFGWTDIKAEIYKLLSSLGCDLKEEVGILTITTPEGAVWDMTIPQVKG